MAFKKDIRISKVHFWFALLLFIILMKLCIFNQPIIDWDEEVYMYLSQHMSWLLGNYTVKGSYIDNALPQSVYSAPVFHHPPLIPYLIKIVSVFCKTHMAAKIVNLTFIFLSFFSIYRIGLTLSDFKGAVMATFLWAICPIFNLESNIIHLDFPLTVLVLMGTCFYVRYQESPLKKLNIVLSGLFFALAMLTKYTGPIYAIIPLLLILTDNECNRPWRVVFVYGGIVALGFSWWVYIFSKFGSLTPVEFVGEGLQQEIFHSPYLDSIAPRKWYHLWLYFLAICPLFTLYIGGIVNYIRKSITRLKVFYNASPKLRTLVAINVASIICIIFLNIINAYTNSYWTLRHNMPLFPIVYISIGYVVSALFDKGNRIINSYLIVLIFLTTVFMSFSTYITVSIKGNLKPIPVILFWVPGLKSFFH